MFSKTNKEDAYTLWWMEQQKNRTDQEVHVGDMKLFTSRDVFSPDIETTNSVDLLLRQFPDVSGKRVLDIGTGNGVLAIYAALEGAKEVIATDVTASAIENAKRNVEKTGTTNTVSIINQEDFENLPGRFDVVIMNVIFAHSPEDEETREVIKFESLALHKRLFDNIEKILTEDGLIFLGFGSFGDIETLEQLLSNDSLSVSIVEEEKFDVNWYAITVHKRV